MRENQNDIPVKANAKAASLYFGNVMHARLKPVEHRFNYRVFSLLIDIDRLTEAGSYSRVFSVNQKGLTSFHEKDHGYRNGRSLREFVDAELSNAGIGSPATVKLLCYPRVLGYTFNPLSVYFCYDTNGNPTAMLYQVHNTFGASHSYVEQIDSNGEPVSVVKQEADKQLYVSPFIEMNMRYKFRVQLPDNCVKVRILEVDDTGPLLSATFSGKHKAFNTRNLLKGLLQTMGLTWKVTAGIHFEALRLWIKGVKLVPRLSQD